MTLLSFAGRCVSICRLFPHEAQNSSTIAAQDSKVFSLINRRFCMAKFKSISGYLVQGPFFIFIVAVANSIFA